ncbi:MAG: FHA domain-containing protein [Sedimentisphaerales bacterium]|nr:FHA domain-containing protein [Sedimentisphaerales bacterium]
MRLLQKQKGRTTDRFQFAEGPVYLGRSPDCQVLLADKAVSREHAVLFTTDDGRWMVEDLRSANGTYVNGRTIRRGVVRAGDRIRIGSCTLEVDLSAKDGDLSSNALEDTLVGELQGPRVIVRRLEFDHAPSVKMPAHRIDDFRQAAGALGKAHGSADMLQAVVALLVKQFAADRAWCGLRYEPAGPLAAHGGRTRAGETFDLLATALKDKVWQVLEDREFLLLTKTREAKGSQGSPSRMIAPLPGTVGNFGVLYVDNRSLGGPYRMSDLDYLMWLSIHVTAVIENY